MSQKNLQVSIKYLGVEISPIKIKYFNKFVRGALRKIDRLSQFLF